MTPRTGEQTSSFTADIAVDDAGRFVQATIDSLPTLAAVLDERGVILTVNAAWTAAAADDVGVGVGVNYIDVCRRAAASDPECAAGDVADGLAAVLAGHRAEYVVEYAYRGLRYALRAVRFLGSQRPRLLIQHTDVTPTSAESDAHELHSRLLDALDAAVVATDADGMITAWSQGAETLYGWKEHEAVGLHVEPLLTSGPNIWRAGRALFAGDRWEGELTQKRKHGKPFTAYARATTLRSPEGEITGYVGVIVDHTERLQAERDLRSAHDYMRAVAENMGEGLGTLDEHGRVVFLNAHAEAMLGWTTAELAGQDFHSAVHHLRRDGSPYPAGDCPLVAARQQRAPARVEDDALVTRGGSLLQVQMVQTPFETEDGVGGFVVLFNDISARKLREREAEGRLEDLACIARIRHAITNDRFVLHAQPIVHTGTGRTVQHELLIRMLDDDDQIIPPLAFLGVAETYGLIGEIDRWVIHQSVCLAAEGHSVGLNLSAHSLSDPTLYDFVDAELRREHADPSRLGFELTETALLENEDTALGFAEAVSKRGCRLALDDFGTGYGGFSYLKRLPIDYLKIDREFVRDLATDDGSREVILAIVSLAAGFGLQTVAEGVEDARTLDLLADLNVDFAQGFHTGRPAGLDQTLRPGKEAAPCP